MINKKLNVLAFALLMSGAIGAQNNVSKELIIETQKLGAPVQSTMYGLFFEDINFGADGGLYAELIKNRSFDFPQSLMGWNSFGNVSVQNTNSPFENNPNYVRLSPADHGHKSTGIENEGFRGIGFKKGEPYRFSVWARIEKGGSAEKIRVELIDSNNEVITRQDIEINSTEWKKYQVQIVPSSQDYKGKLRVYLASNGTIDLEHVSLFPVNTWKGRENGLRKDLVEALDGLNPGVFRFPGGCIVEGTDLKTRYDWKKSIDKVENRTLNENRWNYTFQHRLYPDYYQTLGLGFYEFFLLSEDLEAEPLPVVNCGLSCQYQNNTMDKHVALEDLDCYIQDALDLIEFANGDITTTWGKKRAEMGHPAPFNLKFLGVGNEQWGPEYVERLDLFVKAIRKAYPSIQIIGSSGPGSEGKDFDYLWPEMARLKVDLVDEHYYRPESWFLSQAARYDNYDRKGPKVFAGEYACHPQNRKNNFESALCEAAFMTGLERNADIVHMATYAPLFAHVDGWQWRPDLIWFDNLRTVYTPNYYVQQLYADNAGTHVLPLKMDKKAVTGESYLYASAVVDQKRKCYIVKIANTAKQSQQLTLVFNGKKLKLNGGTLTVLHSNNMDDVNTLDNPNAIVPTITPIATDGNKLNVSMAPQSFAVYVINY